MNMKRYRNKPINDPSSLSNAVEQTTHIQRGGFRMGSTCIPVADSF